MKKYQIESAISTRPLIRENVEIIFKIIYIVK